MGEGSYQNGFQFSGADPFCLSRVIITHVQYEYGCRCCVVPNCIPEL